MTSPPSNETSGIEASTKEEVDSFSKEVNPPKNGFIPSTLDELKLVVWPSRQQLFSESIAVILMVTLSAASIAAVSRFYGWGASQIFR